MPRFFARCFFFASAGILLFTSLPALQTREPAYLATQDAQLQQADLLEQNHRYDEAIAIYERVVDRGGGRDLRWTAYVLFRLACAQRLAGDRLASLESAGAAVTLDPAEPSYRAFRAELAAETPGRARSTTYRAARDKGSARRLVATNGVLHLFVRGRNTEPWDAGDEQKTGLFIDEADQWLQARASENKRSPVFTHRFLALPDEPFWRRIDVPEADASPDYRDAWMKAVLVRFRAGSYAELFDRVFEGMTLDNRSVVFHTSRRDLSFVPSASCRKEKTDMESVFVHAEHSDWLSPYAAVAYAHAFLHLYGADDLFTKAPGEDAPERDVMNFGADRLDGCMLSALTRYAIGWTDQPPRLTRLRLSAPLPKKGRNG